MNEQKVLRLPCTREACIRRLEEQAQRAFDEGDIGKSLRLMKFVPNPADRPSTPPPPGYDFS